MADLFAQEPVAPLAEALRPKTLDEVIGQSHLLGEGKPLRLAFLSGKPHSMIFWGPPGVGKTTLARLTATAFDCAFIALSAVFSGGDNFYDQISALHKSVRGSNPDAALYWLTRMLDGGADPRYLSRRIVRMAWEDIGLADPRAMQIGLRLFALWQHLDWVHQAFGELVRIELVDLLKG